jgi:hypothetical protein
MDCRSALAQWSEDCLHADMEERQYLDCAALEASDSGTREMPQSFCILVLSVHPAS